MSAPANAKSQSCFLQLWGEVRPSLIPHFVRYSTQFGPPSAVAVWNLMFSLLFLDRVGIHTHLVLNYLIVEQSLTREGKVELVSDKTEVLMPLGSLDIGVGVSKCKSLNQCQIICQCLPKHLSICLLLLTKLSLRTNQIQPLILIEDLLLLRLQVRHKLLKGAFSRLLLWY